MYKDSQAAPALMTSTLAALASVAITSAVSAQTYQIEGLINEGASLFPSNGAAVGAEFDEFGLPDGGYPIPYQAELTIEGTDWEFRFSTTDEEETVFYEILGLPPQRPFFQNDLTRILNEISIEYRNDDSFFTSFDLSLDLIDQSGAWSWFEDCLECDLLYSLPAAKATVTSLVIIPEPSSFWLLALGSLALRTCYPRTARRG